MFSHKKNSLVIFIVVLVIPLVISAKTIEKEFPGGKELEIDLVLGSCEIIKSSDDKVHVKVEYTYDEDYFEAVMEERSTSISLEEKFYGENPDGGKSSWTIMVPDDSEIEFESATGSVIIKNIKAEMEGSSGTGSFEIEGVSGEFDINSGTGRVEVSKSKGEFKLNSGTGRVIFKDCSGELDGNSGTGDVLAENITIEDEAEFNSGTGDVDVIKPIGKDFELSLNSGTGDAVLDMDGQPIEGYFEFQAGANRGDIDSPIEFDDEEYRRKGDNGTVRKWFTRGKSTPKYYISTGTGDAVLKK